MQNLISELLAGIQPDFEIQPDELVQPDVDMQPDQEMPPDLDVLKNLIPNGDSVKSNISELESEYLSGKHREGTRKGRDLETTYGTFSYIFGSLKLETCFLYSDIQITLE